jgi:hypothetical protein
MVTKDTSLSSYEGILDFKEMFSNAMDLFKEQALSAKNSKTISQLELTKAKVNNFNDSIDHITALSHTLEILGADKDRFRRKDELTILNNLRHQCEMQSNIGLANLNMVQNKMIAMAESGEVDAEEMRILQGTLDANIDSAQKVINSVSKLIQLERYSGNRPWGRKANSAPAIGYIKGLDAENETTAGGDSMRGGKTPTRKISVDDMKGLGKPIDYD